MLARRNEDFGAGNGIGAIRLRHGAGADQAKIGAALRLCQVHCPQPLPRHHPGQETRLQLGGTGGAKCGNGAIGQPGIHGKRLVGRRQELLQHKAQHMRQALPAKPLRQRQRAPARLGKLVIGGFEPGGRGHRPVGISGAALGIARMVERGQHLGGKFARFLDNGVGHIGRGPGKPGQMRIARQPQHLVDDKQRVANGRLVTWHGHFLSMLYAYLVPQFTSARPLRGKFNHSPTRSSPSPTSRR